LNRRLAKAAVAGLVAVTIGAIAFVVALRLGVTRPAGGPSSAAVRVDVPQGQPFAELVDRLADAGLIASPWALKVFAAVRGYDRRIQSGTYEFSAAERPVDILGRLMSGDVLMVNVTIPEGYTIWDIAGAFQAANVDSLEMLSALKDADVRAKRHIEAPSLEGYLFPDTYRVRWNVSAREATAMMLERMDEVFDTSMLQRAADVGMTPHEVLTLASIIEAETRVPGERAMVSAVYRNRLERHMRLEADPTVAYAMGGYKGRLLYADLEIESPYNTYRRTGLPPGPICSPGEASIRAALYPDSSTNALYFVARGDGSHIFSRTLRQHNEAVRKLRRERREASVR
jgi:UPF0755 protein